MYIVRSPSILRLLTVSIPLGKNRSVKLPVLLWFTLTAAAILAEWSRHSINNYYIFKGVFWHTVAESNLYAQYPSEHLDVNHYGPFFSIIIFPFALLSDWAGVFAWCLLNSFMLFYAINKLPFSATGKLAALLIVAIEMMTSIHNVQLNPMLAGWLILAFVLTENKKDFWATLFIAAGFMTKIYGMAGLLFFLFSSDKPKFFLSFLFWLVVMFLLPMVFSSPHFIIASYIDWFNALRDKNLANISIAGSSLMQDISVMGFLRRSFGMSATFNPIIIISALLAILIPLLRTNQSRFLSFRLSYLAIVLISIVIFSTSAESPTYVIAVLGVAIWYIISPQSWWTRSVLFFTMTITCLSGTDLFPAYIRDHIINPYSLKALPCILVWLILIGDVAFKEFDGITNSSWRNEARKHYITSVQ